MIKGNIITHRLAVGRRIKMGRLGEERTARESGKTYRQPEKLEHFLVTTNRRGADGNFEVDEELMRALAEDGKPTEIPIVLLSDDVEEIFPTSLAWYHGKSLACRGDGEVAMRFQIQGGKPTGASKEMPCPCEELDKPRGCKPHGILNCMIAVPGHAHMGCVDQLRTTGKMSIGSIMASLSQIKTLTNGVLTGFPLMLKMTTVEVRPEGKVSHVPVAHIELRAGDVERVQSQAREYLRHRNENIVEFRRLRTDYQRLLSAPAVDESDDEIDAVVAEFSPPEPEPEPIVGGRDRMMAKLQNPG